MVCYKAFIMLEDGIIEMPIRNSYSEVQKDMLLLNDSYQDISCGYAYYETYNIEMG